MQLDTVTIPDSLQWVNEFEDNQVEQTHDRTLSGALSLQAAVKVYGRPINLVGGDDGGWISRATALALRALEASPGKVMTLTLADASTHRVVFDRSRGPAFESQMIMRFAYPSDTSWYTCALRLLTVSAP